MPEVSVIIPNFNHSSFLKYRIESVLSQTYGDFELIILDDNSTDNSRGIIESYRHHPKVTQIIYSNRNSGSPFPQWKKGIEQAKGNWIWIAESDDLAEPVFLEEAVSIILSNPSIGCCYTGSFMIDEAGKIISKVSDIKNSFFKTTKWSSSYFANGITELNECLKFLCTINNASAFVFKKKIFTAVQSEVISYRYFGDWFFYIQAMLQTDIYYNHKALSSYRYHPENFISSKSPVVETKKEYYRLLMFLLSRSEVTKKKELIRFFCLHYLGSGWIKEGIGNAVRILWNYFKMDRSIALKVIPKIIWYKITGRKNNKVYP